jgi:hypothetical protein
MPLLTCKDQMCMWLMQVAHMYSKFFLPILAIISFTHTFQVGTPHFGTTYMPIYGAKWIQQLSLVGTF